MEVYYINVIQENGNKGFSQDLNHSWYSSKGYKVLRVRLRLVATKAFRVPRRDFLKVNVKSTW